MTRVRMEVAGLALDSTNNSPIVLLREVVGERVLPIWVGIVEASAIAFELEKVQVQRPMTHDLFVVALQKLGTRIADVAIVGLSDNTYFAEIRLFSPNGDVMLDARPSDALALALRAKAPIFCEEEVLARVQALRSQEPMGEQAREPSAEATAEESQPEPQPRVILRESETHDLKGVLERLSEGDFGKYKM